MLILPQHIAELCKKKSVKIVAVSKLQSLDKIQQLYGCGQKIFGENYLKEALPKIDQLKNISIEWHLIGHLQSNKVKLAVGTFYLIHSVDSLSLLKAIDRVAETKKIIQKVLIQINIASEETKNGFDYNQLLLDWPHILQLKNITICGLMTMPPLTDNPENSRPHFKNLKTLLTQLQKLSDLTVHPLNELSMGTSHDYEIAIEEGATMIRLGTLLFGERISCPP